MESGKASAAVGRGRLEATIRSGVLITMPRRHKKQQGHEASTIMAYFFQRLPFRMRQFLYIFLGGILDDLTTKPPKRMLHLLKIMKSLPH